MSIITTDEGKNFLWIPLSDASQDVEVAQTIDEAETFLYSVLWVDQLLTADYTEWALIDKSRCDLFFKNYPLTELTTISNEAYSGVENTDYFLPEKRRLSFMITPTSQITVFDTNKVLITYKAWYTDSDAVPDKLKLAIKYLLSGLWNTKKDLWIVTCKIGQESAKFATISDQKDFLKIIREFIDPPKMIIL